MQADAVIVGGGLAGLARMHAPSGDMVDIGPHVVHSEYANFLALLERLGTRDRIDAAGDRRIRAGRGRCEARPFGRASHPDGYRLPEARYGAQAASDWTRTELPSSMESAVRSGFLAAEAILSASARPRSLALAPRPTEGLAGLVRAATRLARGSGPLLA